MSRNKGLETYWRGKAITSYNKEELIDFVIELAESQENLRAELTKSRKRQVKELAKEKLPNNAVKSPFNVV